MIDAGVSVNGTTLVPLKGTLIGPPVPEWAIESVAVSRAGGDAVGRNVTAMRARRTGRERRRTASGGVIQIRRREGRHADRRRPVVRERHRLRRARHVRRNVPERETRRRDRETPTPLSFTVSLFEAFALSATCSVAARLPRPDGVNRTLISHEPLLPGTTPLQTDDAVKSVACFPLSEIVN